VDHLDQPILSHWHHRNSNLLRYIPGEQISKGSNTNVAIKKIKINHKA